MLLPTLALVVAAAGQGPEDKTYEVNRNIPYAEKAHERQVLDVYSPKRAKSLPVVFWIHGGGWQTGDKSGVQIKPQVFVNKGFVFVSANYRLLPSVDMATIVRDIAGPSAGFTTTLPSTEATRNAFSLWATRPGRSSPR